MSTTRNTILFLLIVTIAAPGWGGDDDHGYSKKCSEETSACIRAMVDSLSHKGWIGIEWNNDDEIPVLTQVVPGSPAEAAGLVKGDRLLAFNGVSTSAGEEAVWAEAKKSLVPGKTITLAIDRGGVKKSVEVTLVALPRHVMAQWIGNHVIEHHLAEQTAEKAEEGAAPAHEPGSE